MRPTRVEAAERARRMREASTRKVRREIDRLLPFETPKGRKMATEEIVTALFGPDPRNH